MATETRARETRAHETRARLAHRRPGARVGAVDEYAALQRAALDRVVHHGLDAAAAALRLRAEAERLVVRGPLDTHEAAAVVAPYVDATEAAIAELNDEFRHLTAHVLRMARYRLGLC
jgi:hypothetical protein